MARRLARLLQPRTDAVVPVAVPAKADHLTVTAASRQKKTTSRWSLFRDNAASGSSPPQASPRPAAVDRLVMTVKAEEVTFRKENDFGIWESRHGIAIVVRVRVHQG